MESTFGQCETGLCHTYKHIEIVKIDGKKYVKKNVMAKSCMPIRR